MKKYDYKKLALQWFRDHLGTRGSLRKRVQEFRSDYRMGSIPKTISLYCESGGLYTTTPSKPSNSIRVKTLQGNKTLATFEIADLVKNL